MYVMYVMYVCMYVCEGTQKMMLLITRNYVCMYVGMYVCMCTSQFRPISMPAPGGKQGEKATGEPQRMARRERPGDGDGIWGVFGRRAPTKSRTLDTESQLYLGSLACWSRRPDSLDPKAERCDCIPPGLPRSIRSKLQIYETFVDLLPMACSSQWCCGLCQWPARFTLAAVLPKAHCSRFDKFLYRHAEGGPRHEAQCIKLHTVKMTRACAYPRWPHRISWLEGTEAALCTKMKEKTHHASWSQCRRPRLQTPGSRRFSGRVRKREERRITRNYTHPHMDVCMHVCTWCYVWM